MADLKFEEKYLETNGIRLHTVLAGPQSGVPVILLHGFPEYWRCWSHQIPALVAAGFRVIVPNQRGYNLSDKPKGIRSYRVDELVKDILGLIDKLEYERVNLVGHDWGAIVSWMLAYQHPERLQRLGILNVPHPLVLRRFVTRDLEQMRRSLYSFFFQLPWLPERALQADDWRGAVQALRGSGKIHAFTNEDIKMYKEAWSQPGAMTAMINWYRAVRYQMKLPDEMLIRVPTLMMWGMKDVALTHRMARPSIDHCVDGKLIFFPDATHWVQHEEAEEVNHHLIDFLLDKGNKQAIR
ncbi:MAG: alpha/beta fold hydrolase [Syntrophothermus sp.]